MQHTIFLSTKWNFPQKNKKFGKKNSLHFCFLNELQVSICPIAYPHQSLRCAFHYRGFQQSKNKHLLVLSHFFNLTFCQVDILTTWHFVKLTFWQLDTCLPVIMSMRYFVNMTFCQLDILSTWHFVNLTFCQHDILSTWDFTNLTFLKLDIS